MDDETRETELEKAALCGDVTALRQAAAGGYAPEVAAAALLSTAENGHWPAAQFLVEEEKINLAIDGAGALALQHAAVAGRLDVIDMLVLRGVSLKSAAGSKVLLSSASTGQMDVLRYVVEGGADVSAAGGEAAWSAAKAGCWEAVALIAAAGADLDSGDVGLRLLALAVARKQEDFAALLVARGYTAQSRAGEAALAYLASTCEWEPCEGCVRYLVVSGADVTGEAGRTALVTASAYGDLEMLQLLLGRGADARSAAGADALASAGLLGPSNHTTQQVVDFLVANGAVASAPPALILDADF